MENNNLQEKFCGRTHGKFFEVILIMTFSLGTIFLTINLAVTE